MRRKKFRGTLFALSVDFEAICVSRGNKQMNYIMITCLKSFLKKCGPKELSIGGLLVYM
jgi:hypothetical protein